MRKPDRSTRNRIVEAITSLADEPRPAGCRKIQSEEGVWRIRIGDWRIGYMIEEITVIRIAHRKEFYF